MGKSFLASSSILEVPGILCLWLHKSNLCLCLHMSFSSSFCVSLFCVSFLRTLVIGFRAHMDNPGWSQPHLEIPNFITATRILSPNKVTFIGFWDTNWTYPSGCWPSFYLTTPSYSENTGQAFLFLLYIVIAIYIYKNIKDNPQY